MVSESKMDENLSIKTFLIHRSGRPYRLDRDSKGRQIMLNVRVDIPSIFVIRNKEHMKVFTLN